MTPTPPPALLYPGAIWSPLVDHSDPGQFANRNLIVLHITEGSSAASAITTFKASVHPHRVSAHFVIERDGTVYQLLSLEDTAWHASEVNPRSIGIEHAATSKALSDHAPMNVAMPATDAQYSASSRLVAWLCKKMLMDCDRDHVKTHNEASPADGHVKCCTGGLDPDRVVTLAASIITP